MADQDDGAVRALREERGDVRGVGRDAAQEVRWGQDGEALALKLGRDGVPAGAVGPGSVYQHDRGLRHVGPLAGVIRHLRHQPTARAGARPPRCSRGRRSRRARPDQQVALRKNIWTLPERMAATCERLPSAAWSDDQAGAVADGRSNPQQSPSGEAVHPWLIDTANTTGVCGYGGRGWSWSAQTAAGWSTGSSSTWRRLGACRGQRCGRNERDGHNCVVLIRERSSRSADVRALTRRLVTTPVGDTHRLADAALPDPDVRDRAGRAAVMIDACLRSHRLGSRAAVSEIRSGSFAGPACRHACRVYRTPAGMGTSGSGCSLRCLVAGWMNTCSAQNPRIGLMIIPQNRARAKLSSSSEPVVHKSQ